MNIPSGFFVLSWLFACLLTGGLPGRCAGQTGGNSVSFTHLTPDDGLSGARVRSFCHDSKGFIWIGAEGGLNRFDGYKCAVYEPVPGGKGSLGGNMVPALLEDSRGNFWVGTNEGLQLMDRVAGLFFPPAGADQNPLNAIGHVLTLKEDRDGTVWAGTTAGLFRLLCGATTAFSRENFHRQVAKGELRLVRFSHNDQDARSLSHNHVWSIETDRAGCLWLGTGRGLNRLDPKTNTIERFPFPDIPGAGALATATVNTLLFDRAGYFWIGTANGLYRIAPGEKTMRVFRAAPNRPDGLSNDFVTHIVEDGQGRLWVGSDGGGLDLWNPGTGAFIRHQHDPDDPKSLNDNNIEALYADRDGGLWVGHHKGLSYRSRYQKPFQVYRNTGGKATLSPGGILCLFVGADGTVWTGIDDGGMDALDQETGAVAHFQRLPGNAQSIGDDDVVAIFEDSRGTVWIGTWGGGLSRFIPRLPKGRTSGVFLHNSPDGKPGSIGDNDIVHFYEDKKGALWLGTVDDGLNAFDPAANTFRSFRWPVRDPGNLFKNWVFDIAEDRKGDLWVANIEGLGRLNRSAGAIENFPLSRKSQRSRIYCLHPHPDGGFWLGADDGLFLFDPEKKSLRHWRRQDGLADNAVTCILEDARGNLWLGAPKGISRLNVRTGDIRVYDARDGLLGGAYTAGAIDRRSGELLFAGANGINVFHPDSIRENPQPPPVVITGFRLFNRPVPVSGSPGDTLDFASPLQREIFYSEAIRLPHWQNDFSFEFAALNYLNPEKNRYKYRLEGYRDNWIETEAGENSAHYTNLSPGTYTFTVIGSNNDGVWNQTGATVRIVIARPWWGAWWAYLLYLLALGGVLYWLIRKELKEQQLRLSLELERVETEQLKEIDKTKSRLYANITHEFRTPLTVILGMVEQVEKNPQTRLGEGLALIRRNSQNLLGLINQMLDLAKLESRQMQVQLEQGDIVAYVKYVAESFQSAADAKDIILRIGSEPESIVMDYDPGKMLQILSNLLSNAVKFTPAGGEIALRLAALPASGRTGDRLRLTVADTGIGIPAGQLPFIFDRFYQADNSSTRRGEGTGIGLALTLELVRLLKGEITAESAPGKGATFNVQLPITRGALAGAGPAPLPGVMPGRPAGASDGPASGEADWPLLLLVEDHADVRTLLIRCLEHQYRIETASDGQSGIEKALELVPDLIISDVMMPGKDGFELSATLKNDPRTSHIPLLMLTARTAVTDRIAGLERGADAYLAKPFHQAELLAQLKNLLESRLRWQEYYRNLEAPALQNTTDGKAEDAFLLKFRGLIEGELANAELSIDDLCRRMAMSRMQLHRKTKALTGRSTALYIRSVRLQHARRLLLGTAMNVSEVAYKVGFDDPKYFSRVFAEEFGMAPSDLRD